MYLNAAKYSCLPILSTIGFLNRSKYMSFDEYILSREVQFLHQQFFKFPAPPELTSRYLRLHSESPILFEASQAEARTVSIVVNKQLDALGIEPWLRGSTRRHLLSRKLLLIAYLSECDAAHLEFRQEVRGQLPCWMHLCFAPLQGAWHLLAGRLQKAMHELI